MSRTLMERDQFDVIMLDSVCKAFINVGQGQDRVAPRQSRQRVHEIHNAILEPAHCETVHNVNNEGRRHRAPQFFCVEASA